MTKEPFAALLTTIWIGRFLFWMLKGFNGGFSDELTEKSRKRNMITGCIVQVAILTGLYLIIKK